MDDEEAPAGVLASFDELAVTAGASEEVVVDTTLVWGGLTAL